MSTLFHSMIPFQPSVGPPRSASRQTDSRLDFQQIRLTLSWPSTSALPESKDCRTIRAQFSDSPSTSSYSVAYVREYCGQTCLSTQASKQPKAFITPTSCQPTSETTYARQLVLQQKKSFDNCFPHQISTPYYVETSPFCQQKPCTTVCRMRNSGSTSRLILQRVLLLRTGIARLSPSNGIPSLLREPCTAKQSLQYRRVPANFVTALVSR
jgi:hypothetical protein